MRSSTGHPGIRQAELVIGSGRASEKEMFTSVRPKKIDRMQCRYNVYITCPLYLSTPWLVRPRSSVQISSSFPNNSNVIHIQTSIFPAIYLTSRLHLKRRYLGRVWR